MVEAEVSKHDPFLLAETRRFCEVDFDEGGYVELDRRDTKVMHISLHLQGILEKLFAIDHEAQTQRKRADQEGVVGDLGIYRSMLMDEFGVTETALNPGAENAVHAFALALGGIKRYLEPRHHGATSSEGEITDVAIPNLHTAQVGFALQWSVQPIVAQAHRMHRPHLGLDLRELVNVRRLHETA